MIATRDHDERILYLRSYRRGRSLSRAQALREIRLSKRCSLYTFIYEN